MFVPGHSRVASSARVRSVYGAHFAQVRPTTATSSTTAVPARAVRCGRTRSVSGPAAAIGLLTGTKPAGRRTGPPRGSASGRVVGRRGEHQQLVDPDHLEQQAGD